MLKISKLETRFQEIVFLVTIALALSAAAGGLFYLTLNPESFMSAMGQSGSALIRLGFKLFGLTYFLTVIFLLHMGHLVLATSLYVNDAIRSYPVYLRSFAVYFTVLLLISSFIHVLQIYNGWEPVSSLMAGYGGWFGNSIGGYLYRAFGLYGAMVILFTITSVIGISAGYMEIVHSFYVMKDIVLELTRNIREQGPQKARHFSQKAIEFLDQKPRYAHASAGVSATVAHRVPPAENHWDNDTSMMRFASSVESLGASDQKIRSSHEGGIEGFHSDAVRSEKEQLQLILNNLKEISAELFEQDNHEKKEVSFDEPKKRGRKKKLENKTIDGEFPLGEPDAAGMALESTETKEDLMVAPWTRRYQNLELSLLDKAQTRSKKSEKEIREISLSLQSRLESFGIKGEMIKAHQGVTLTLFEFQPSAGMKLSKIQSLSDDLALVLGAPSIRLLTPIPGKNTVGIEVPNSQSQMLRFSEMVESCLKSKGMALPVPLGIDVYNKVHVNDLTKMPHLLVSGTTGSGKSVFMNSLISSLIFHKSPKDLRFLMIDPKMIELSPYNGIPHLLKPVITDVEEAKNLLLWAEEEMDRRYKMFSDTQSKNINTFNAAVKKGSKKSIEGRLGKKIEWKFEEIPYIVIVIDELADLMLTQRQEVERPITRIAQKARAAGIHMVMATQRPSSDIVTGLIKTNFPTRVSFKVSSGIDSRTILDQPGAEKLLGNGDMLFLAQGQPLERLQGSYMSEDEVKRVVNAALLQAKKN